MRNKLGVALLCVLLTAVLYAATEDGFDSSASSASPDGSSDMSASMSMQTMAAVAADQPIESLASELPAHDPTVGKLAGSAGTSGGAASYEIPIALPPGRRGMQPSFSLGYSSRAGNGIAGMGWSLSGLSSLHRCPATIEQDGMIGAVALTNADKLCLDGQRLIPTSGTYGAINTIYDTELESFVKVTQLGGDLLSASTYFKVETKSGDVLWYGNNSTAANVARVVPGNVTVPLSWMLMRKEDRLGNFIHYIYTSYGNGEVLLTDAVYTGFVTTEGNRHVKFTYQTRPAGTSDADQSSSYLAGGVTRQTQRLTVISTWASDTEEVREYRLAYGATTSLTTHRSLLASVQDCGFLAGASACRPPTTFTWQQGPIQTNFHPAVLPAGLSVVGVTGDFDGDGSREVFTKDASNHNFLVSLKADRTVKTSLDVTTAGTFNLIGFGSETTDFDLDGKSDLFATDPVTHHLKIYFWDGPSTATTFAQAFTRQWDTGITGLSAYAVRDMDGDGRADIVIVASYPSNPDNCKQQLEIYRNVPNPGGPSLAATFPLMASQCLAVLHSGLDFFENPVGIHDVNGDGLPDILISSLVASATPPVGSVLLGQRGTTYSLNKVTYASLFPGSDPLTSAESDAHGFTQWMDINGDGLEDLLNASLGGNWSLRLNTGKGFGNRIQFTSNHNGIESCTLHQGPSNPSCTQVWQPWYASHFQTADIDGDGRQELLIPRRFASQVCMLTTDRSNPQEPVDYYACPEDPMTGSLNTTAVSNVIASGTPVRGMYIWGQGGLDRSAYLMNALRFVETGPNQFQIVEEQTSRVNGQFNTPADLYGDGLEDSLTDVSCGYVDPNECMVAAGAGTPATLPGGYAHLSTGPFVSENRGPNGQMDPDGVTPELPDLMSMVTDGFGAQTVWTYYQLSSNAGRVAGQTPLYTVPTDPAQRYVDDRHVYFSSSMPVVSDMSSSDGLGGYRVMRYGYSQAMYNEQGRGFQGFRTIIEEDLAAGLRTTTTFNQKFPLAGQLLDVVVNAMTRTGTDGALKHESYTWRCNLASRSDATACTPPNGTATIKFPYLDKKETWTFDSAVALLATGAPSQIGYSQDVNADDSTCAGSFATTSGFDVYGNLTAHTVLSSDSGTGTGGLRAFVALQCQRVRSTYTANTSTWWLDRLDSTTTTSAITYNSTNHLLPTGVSNPAQTLTTANLWNADRTLQQQTLQSGLLGEQDITTYVYPTSNNYGLPISVSVNASQDYAGVRASGIAYSADGYFPYVMSNPLGQNSSVTTSARDGQPTLTVDANGLRTLMTFDVFGQLVRTQYHGATDTVQALPDRAMALSWCNNLCDPGTQSLYKATAVQDGSPVTITAYDKLGRSLLVAQRALDNSLPRTLTQYNARGLVSAQSQPYLGDPAPIFWTTFLYDALGRVTQKIVPKGAEDGRGDLKTIYAFSGLQTAIQVCGSADVGTTNCLNLTRTTDSQGRYMETVDAQAGVTQFWTDASGHTLALVDAKGSVTRAAYNGTGQRTSVTDPNQGTWSFLYDALGELLQQTDARNVVTTSRYDKLGRPISRSVSVDITGDNIADAIADSWTYDPLNGIGKPAISQRLVNAAIERKQVFTYDTLARPIQTDTTQQIAVGQTKAYTQTLAYDTYYGRPKSTGYPNGEAVGTYYDKYGHPIRSFNPADGSVYREITAVNTYGSPTLASLGAGLLTDTRTYRPSTDELLQIKTTKSGTTLRQLDYQTDVFGNLSRQTLNSGATVENYSYDTVQRMIQATRTGAVSNTINYAYDAVGNFTSKSDFSTTAANAYNYMGGSCGGGPNAVKSVVTPGGTRNYCYDADGNLISDSVGLAVKYDHENLAFQTTRGASTIFLAYGPDNQRTRQWGTDGTKVYVDGYEDWISAGSTKVYIGGDAEITTTATTRTVNYLLTDRLGSVDSVSDSTGALVEIRGSDAFGKPRSGTWADLSPARLQSTSITEHGFTGHEHLNSVELIHMNGRVYDYALGRFLSVDPFIQFPLNSQSLNPYSYVLNNPLAGTDPTGYCSAQTGSHITRCENLQAVYSDGSTKDLGRVNTRSTGDVASAQHSAIAGQNQNGGSGGQGSKPNSIPARPLDNFPGMPAGPKYQQMDEIEAARTEAKNDSEEEVAKARERNGESRAMQPVFDAEAEVQLKDTVTRVQSYEPNWRPGQTWGAGGRQNAPADQLAEAREELLKDRNQTVCSMRDAGSDSFEKTSNERVSSRTLRSRWENFYGTKWPKDPATGRNQDVSHQKALADKGTNDVTNIEPLTHAEHVRQHSEAGDFQRWGAMGAAARKNK
jgi:RHS repeat-associated protein